MSALINPGNSERGLQYTNKQKGNFTLWPLIMFVIVRFITKIGKKIPLLRGRGAQQILSTAADYISKYIEG